MLVDTHVHVVSRDEAAYPLDPRPGSEPWYRDHASPVEEFNDLMDAASVDRAVLVQGVSAYTYDNRYTVEAAKRFPERHVSVVCLGLGEPDVAGTLRAMVRDDGVAGLRWLKLRGEEGGLEEPRAVWTAAEELALPVVVTMLADGLEHLAAAAATVPRVSLALDHCGFADFSEGIPDALLALVPLPNANLKVTTIALDRGAEHGDVADFLAELVATFGADRLMWGSDWSQTHDRPYGAMAELARSAAQKLSDDDRDLYFAGTALRLWPKLA